MNDTLPPLANDDELGQLTNSFQHISRRMADLSSELETNVQSNQHRLQLAAQINREMTNIRSSDELMERVSERLCEELKFYHAQVYLLDDIGMIAHCEGHSIRCCRCQRSDDFTTNGDRRTQGGNVFVHRAGRHDFNQVVLVGFR